MISSTVPTGNMLCTQIPGRGTGTPQTLTREDFESFAFSSPPHIIWIQWYSFIDTHETIQMEADRKRKTTSKED